jgi:hypothetical protein
MSMCPRPITRLALLSLLLLPLAACAPPSPGARPADQAMIDQELRTYLGIRTLRGTFTLPTKAQGYFPVAIMFADGVEVARASVALQGLKDRRGPMSGEIQLLMPADAKLTQRAVLIDGGNKRDLTELYPHWNDFTSGGWRPIASNEEFRYDGVSICAIFVSTPGAAAQLHPSPDKLATAGKYVVAIGLVHGEDFEALKRQFEALKK